MDSKDAREILNRVLKREKILEIQSMPENLHRGDLEGIRIYVDTGHVFERRPNALGKNIPHELYELKRRNDESSIDWIIRLKKDFEIFPRFKDSDAALAIESI